MSKGVCPLRERGCLTRSSPAWVPTPSPGCVNCLTGWSVVPGTGQDPLLQVNQTCPGWFHSLPPLASGAPRLLTAPCQWLLHVLADQQKAPPTRRGSQPNADSELQIISLHNLHKEHDRTTASWGLDRHQKHTPPHLNASSHPSSPRPPTRLSYPRQSRTAMSARTMWLVVRWQVSSLAPEFWPVARAPGSSSWQLPKRLWHREPMHHALKITPSLVFFQDSDVWPDLR